MKMTVAFNGDLDLIEKYAENKDVESIFVKMTEDILGGGRSAFLLPDIDFEKMKEIVDKAHKLGIKVNYVFNSACQSNDEFTKDYNDKLFNFINSLSEIGIDGAVVASPFMLNFIKHNWPHMWVTVSIFAFADNVKKVGFWDERGADRVILPMTLGRNFEGIKKIRESIKCEIEMIANLGCLRTCPIDRYHSAFVSHNSNIKDLNSRFVIDYHVVRCSLEKMKNPVELIKSRWIRPEDVKIYEQLGVDTIKITDRIKNSTWLSNVVNAYQNRCYDGNLIDLIHVSNFYGDKTTDLNQNTKRNELSNINGINREVLNMYRSCKQVRVNIKNKKLSNFIEYFQKIDCNKLNCGIECRYCYDIANNVMEYDKESIEYNIEILTRILENIHNRSMFN